MYRLAKKILLFCTINIASLTLAFSAGAQNLEEFNGPFKSWADIKLRFGAKGNGKDDDTKAFQKAIDELSNLANKFNIDNSPYTVLYIPAGTYIISSTLSMKGKIGVSIIGEDPVNTIIKWEGPNADTMMCINGCAYYKISRLTWDGNNKKEMEGLGIHWKNIWRNAKSESFASVNIEISDNIFTGKLKYGISGGTHANEGTNANDSEITIRRCVFINCGHGGIYIKGGYNALDYWIWDCRFISCFTGILSMYGNYHAYRSYFKNSKHSDVWHRNGYYTSVRGCFSEGSRAFCEDDGFSTNPFKRIFQGNTVLSTDTLAIQYYHWGKVSFWDNFFDKSKDTSVHKFINTGSWGGGTYEVLSINNIYRDKSPVTFSSGPNKFYSFNDKFTISTSQTSSTFLENQDKTPKKIKRKVYDVPINADEIIIQKLINAAVSQKNQRPIIHFPPGKFIIRKPLVIPAGLDVQLVGDGLLYSSMIEPSADFPEGKSLINVTGPVSAFIIKDLQLGRFDTGKKSINAIEFVNIDQAKSQAFIDQLYTNSRYAIFAEDLDYLYIQKDNSFFSSGNYISGGRLVQKGQGTARFNFFCSQFAGLEVDKNATAVVKDCWWEGEERKPLNFSGSGNITIDGAMIAPNKADSNTTVALQRFSGKVSLLNMYIQGGIGIEASNPSLSVLLWNIHFYHTLDPMKFMNSKSSFKIAALGLTTQCFTGEKKCENMFLVKDVIKGVPELKTYIPEMLADDRLSTPRRYTLNSDAGVSNIFISRISIGDCNKAIKFSK